MNPADSQVYRISNFSGDHAIDSSLLEHVSQVLVPAFSLLRALIFDINCSLTFTVERHQDRENTNVPIEISLRNLSPFEISKKKKLSCNIHS